jgi:hypothetical protein
VTHISNDNIQLVSNEAIKRAARAVVASAINGDFPIDPIIGPELSKTFSIINSVVKRHGHMLQRGLGDALAASGRFDVMNDVPMPITGAAHDLLTSENSSHDLAKIRLKSDSSVIRMVTIDLVVVDQESGWAGGYDVKRGNGATESRKRRPIEHDLRASRLVMASFLEKQGYEGIRNVTTGVIDCYGSSGFSKELKLTKEQLDEHFGVPVLSTIDAITTELQAALHAEMRRLLAPALKFLPHVQDAPSIADDESTHPLAKAVKLEDDEVHVARLMSARPMGPGLRHSRDS